MLPLWKLQFLHPLIPRQRKASEAVALIRQTTEQLIAKCREMVDAEEQVCLAPSPHSISCLSTAPGLPGPSLQSISCLSRVAGLLGPILAMGLAVWRGSLMPYGAEQQGGALAVSVPPP